MACSKSHSELSSANFGNENKVSFWIPHEILYEIDTHIEYPKFTFHGSLHAPPSLPHMVTGKHAK